MNFLEAINSGQTFRVVNSKEHYEVINGQVYNSTLNRYVDITLNLSNQTFEIVKSRNLNDNLDEEVEYLEKLTGIKAHKFRNINETLNSVRNVVKYIEEDLIDRDGKLNPCEAWILCELKGEHNV